MKEAKTYSQTYSLKLKLTTILLLFTTFGSLFSSCSSELLESVDKQARDQNADAVFTGSKGRKLRIVSGSENRVLEPILAEFSKQYKIGIEIDYSGSLEIMRLLEADKINYDAVWPASSLWISLGDKKHRVKHLESTSTTPVIFGIRKSLAEELGFTEGDVYVKDILEAIKKDKLKFTMTSATQSNSGACAYLGFINALQNSPGQLEIEDLKDEEFQKEITALLAGVERSSGSSDWLKELYLKGDYDAMVNYEALIISANEELEKAGRETMYAVYPVDGMMPANSPLGFISETGNPSRDEKAQEETFLELQNYLLSEEVQREIHLSGRRTGYGKTEFENDQEAAEVFRKDWGIDTEKILNAVNMPKEEVVFEALNLYQSSFKRDALNIYLLDFSGSMYGRGIEQLRQALSEIMIKENAAANFLQVSEREINVFIPFSNNTKALLEAEGADEMQALYSEIAELEVGGGTALYEALIEAFDYLQKADTKAYSCSVIVMSDGKANGAKNIKDFEKIYRAGDYDIPVFSILFGAADDKQMQRLAELTRGKVFDGREDLTAAFRSVRGYN